MNHRIATVKATGERFLVAALDFATKRAVCWGQLESFEFSRNTLRVLGTRHGAGKSFPLDAVQITQNVPLTKTLCEALLAQAERSAVPARRANVATLGAAPTVTDLDKKINSIIKKAIES